MMRVMGLTGSGRVEKRIVRLIRPRVICTVGCFLLSLVTSSCIRDDTVQGWTGHHRDELVKTWGAPSQETMLPDGGMRVLYSNPWENGYGRFTCRRVFATDAQGTIRSASSSDC